jgi:hypothetical protein
LTQLGPADELVPATVVSPATVDDPVRELVAAWLLGFEVSTPGVATALMWTHG